MNGPSQPPLPRRRVTWLALMVVVVLVVIGLVMLRKPKGNPAMLDAIRAAGQPVTLEEWDQWHPPVPPEENKALAIEEAIRLVRQLDVRGLLSKERLHEADRKSGALPSQEERIRWKAISDSMTDVWAALERARGRTRSRHAIDWASVPWHDTSRSLAARSLLSALKWRARAAMAEGKVAEVVVAMRDGLDLAESHLSGPAHHQTLGQILTYDFLKHTAEMLSAGTLDEDGMAGIQGRLEAMASTNRLFVGLVGERVMTLSKWERELEWALGGTAGNSGRPFLPMLYSGLGLADADQAFLLGKMAAFIEASRGSWSDVWKVIPKEPGDASSETPGIGDWLTVGAWGRHLFGDRGRYIFGRLAEQFVRDEAAHVRGVQLAIVMLAVERHRLAHGGRLPGKLDDLVPTYLKALPLDPFEGRPPTYRVMEKGYEVGALWKNGTPWFPGSEGDGARAAEEGGILRVER